MLVPPRAWLSHSAALAAAASLALLAACTDAPSPTRPTAGARSADVVASSMSLPSGERQLGQTSVEPAYDDVTGTITYLLTPAKAPFPSKANAIATAPLYLVEYPGSSTVGTVNCMGVPGNCPDHDGEVAGAATAIMPSVYGTDPTKVLGHDHLVAVPASGGDFNIAWQVVEVLFTSSAAANTHITTMAQLQTAIAHHDVITVPLPVVFNCSVVSGRVYWNGTPVG